MQSFIMEASMEFKVVVPESVLKEMRDACQAEDASEFQKIAQAQYPEDDDEFVLMILRNALKREIRNHVLALLRSAGMGGTFSPVQMRDRTPPLIAHALASDINASIG